MPDKAGDNKSILAQLEELRILNKKLTSLHWISVQIAAEQDIDMLLNLIVNGYSSITGIGKCGLYIIDEQQKFVEAVSREKEDDEPFWSCPRITKIFEQVSTEKTLIVKLSSDYCGNCSHSRCEKLCLHISAIYDRWGKTTGLLVGYSRQYIGNQDDWAKILELYILQVSLALENAILNARLRNLAITDGLTGLYNHRYFMECLQEIHQHCQKHQKPYCLMFIDVDNYKRFNDNFGHLAGDSVLQIISSIMRRIVDKPGTVYRYGGEEFTVLLPGFSLKQSYHMAEKIRRQISKQKFNSCQITVSIGLAQFDGDLTCTASQILQLSNKVLHEAKARGKNYVCIANCDKTFNNNEHCL